MATYVHQYVQALVNGQVAAAQMLNVNLYGISREEWVQLLVVDTAIGVVMKAITEIAPGVATDAFWIDRISHALDQSAQLPWPADLLNQVNPNQT